MNLRRLRGGRHPFGPRLCSIGKKPEIAGSSVSVQATEQKLGEALDGGPPFAHVVLAERDGRDAGKRGPNPEADERSARGTLVIHPWLIYHPEARTDVTATRA
jgi:hypothetical protein